MSLHDDCLHGKLNPEECEISKYHIFQKWGKYGYANFTVHQIHKLHDRSL